MDLNDKVWPDLDLGRSNPKAGVGQILKLYLEYFSSYKHFSKLKRKT